MGTSAETPKKSLAQKGQGMLEYALMMSFVAMLYLVVFADGGVGGAIIDTFDNAGELVASASERANLEGGGSSSSGGGSSSVSSDDSSGGSSSSDVVEHTIEQIVAKDYKPLNWQQVIKDIHTAYETITRGKEADKAIKSEYNLFAGVGSMVSGTLEYNYDEQKNLAGWNDLMNQMGGQIEANNFTTYYVKDNESLDIQRVENRIVMTYTKDNDKKIFSIYAETNEMKFESKIGSETKYGEAALTEYTSIGGAIYSDGWQFKNNS